MHLTTVPDSFPPDFPPGASCAKLPSMTDEIVEWRLQLEQILTRSIEAKLDVPSLYRSALRLVRRLERDVPGLTSRLPKGCPYTFEQIVSGGDEDWFPPPRDRGP